MSQILSNILAKAYWLIIYVTFITILVLGVGSFKYAIDLSNEKYFTKITCNNIYYGKLNIRDGNKNWYCELEDSTQIHIALLEEFNANNAVFETNEVWYNPVTNRAYKYSQELMRGRLTKKINWNIFYASCLILLSVVAIYENTKRNK